MIINISNNYNSMDEQNTSSEEMSRKELYDTQKAEKQQVKVSEQKNVHQKK